MRIASKFACCLGMGFVLCLSALGQNSDVRGTVRDIQGTKVFGVHVMGNHHFEDRGYRVEHTNTDEQGNFKLASVGRVISFRSQDLQPYAYIRKSDEASFEIVLKPASRELPAQTCSTEKSQGSRYGDFVMFLVPGGVHVQQSVPDADNVHFFISAPKSKNEKLILWSGPLLGGGLNNEAPEEWLLGSTSFSERQIWGGMALDVRGKSGDGKNWRYVSSFMDIVQYHDVSDDAAHFFDKIIDSACVRQAPTASQASKKN